MEKFMKSKKQFGRQPETLIEDQVGQRLPVEHTHDAKLYRRRAHCYQ